ncbi:MAG: ATP-binding cassette domain-containing protein [Pseudomonadota bacterium]
METPLIEFRDVTKRFNGKVILDKVNLKIFENQVTTIIGKSGTGKSVLLKHIAGLLIPDEGEILLEGKSIAAMKKEGSWERYRSHISYMFQGNALFDSMTVFDNVALPLRRTTNLKRKEISEKVMARLTQTELTDVTGKYPSELSGGMQKRVALARALVMDPKIVLFDEPTTGQDLVRRNVILSMISQYKRMIGFNAIMISHDIPDVLFISDRIILLWEGTVAFQGTYEETSNLDHPMIDEFLKSLEGFQDELTGLLPKQMFRSRYATTFGREQEYPAGTAILFSVKFDQLAESLGHYAAVEVVKTLGAFINQHLGAAGGFSTRLRRGQILTIIPYLDVSEGPLLVEDFSTKLKNEALASMQSVTQATIGAENCFEMHIMAGITSARSNDDIQEIMRNAEATQKTIAVYRCAEGTSAIRFALT